MKKFDLTKNWGLKLASFLIAFFIWLAVVNINDPQTSQPFHNIQVKLQNTDIITDQDMVYEVLDNTDVITTVTVYGPRSVVDDLNADNIVATANLEELSSLNTVSVSFYSNKNNSELTNIKGSSDTVKLNIENKKTIQLVLKTQIDSNVADGYIVGDVSTDQNLIRISGPESVVSRVSKAVAVVGNLEGFSSDIATNVDVTLYDDEGNVVEDSSLTKTPSTVLVKVPILETKTVDVLAEVSGTPAEGYVATGDITIEPATVVIAGKSSALRNVTSITIPEDALNITGQTEDMVTTLGIKSYLPENVVLGDSSFDGKVTVTIAIGKIITEDFTLTEDNIQIINVPDGYTAELATLEEDLIYSITGLSELVDAVNENSLVAEADVTAYLKEAGYLPDGDSQGDTTEEEVDLKEGTYSIPLTVELDDELTSDSKLHIRIILTKNQ
ncbi:MAG: hypothetical protein K5682_02350 [Lachnospiraceae bacterium]|nr:hypothetical protein [Lachnospiraceae bacterium]